MSLRTVQLIKLPAKIGISTYRFRLALVLALTLIFTLHSSLSYSQISQIDRIEIPVSKDYEIRGLYNFGEEGIVVSTKEVEGKSRRDPDRIFRHYNTNLEETGTHKIEVPFRQKYSTAYESDSAVYILHHDTKFGDFTLVELSGSNLEEKRTAGVFPRKTMVHRMMCYGNYALIYGSVAKRSQKIFVLNLETADLRTIKLEQESRRLEYRRLDFHVQEDGSNAFMLFQICSKKTCYSYELYRFNQEGKEYFQTIETGQNQIVSASMKALEDGSFLVTGTYSSGKQRLAEGMFITQYKNGSQLYYKEHPFTEFERFLDFMTDRQKERYERKIERRRQRGRDVSIQMQMVLHEAIESDNQFVVVGEAYYPTYRNETRPGPNGGSVTYTVFDGYQYSHATIAAFNLNGDKVYDNTFDMFLFDKPNEVKRCIELGVDGKRISMAYVDAHFIVTKIFEDGEAVEDEKSELLTTLQSGDRIKGTNGEIEYWHDNFFVSYGFQFIKNRSHERGNRKRYVFFIQKLEF